MRRSERRGSATSLPAIESDRRPGRSRKDSADQGLLDEVPQVAPGLVSTGRTRGQEDLKSVGGLAPQPQKGDRVRGHVHAQHSSPQGLVQSAGRAPGADDPGDTALLHTIAQNLERALAQGLDLILRAERLGGGPQQRANALGVGVEHLLHGVPADAHGVVDHDPARLDDTQPPARRPGELGQVRERVLPRDRAVAPGHRPRQDGVAPAVVEPGEHAQEVDGGGGDAQAGLGRLEGEQKALASEHEDSNPADPAALTARLREAEAERDALRKRAEQCSAALARNREAFLTWQKLAAEQAEALQHFRAAKSLAETASGQLSGQEKLMLETYVQLDYFERIIVRANIRLMEMTEGRYELVRSKEAENKRSQSGLSLDVIDHYNGGQRSVKSLSGGESFQASLALALGLSDTVQEEAGGIRLDAMFIDEGFGTLDEGALRNALQALLELAADARLVGVISHVPELKEKIERQIRIRKQPEGGSSAELVLP